MIHTNIHTLTQIAGVLSAIAAPAGVDDVKSSGDPNLHQLLLACLDLAPHTAERRFRVVAGTETVIVERYDAEIVAIAIETGHSVAKSLGRTTRRMHASNKPPKTVAPSAS